jgi:uncharacterized membrane protein
VIQSGLRSQKRTPTASGYPYWGWIIAIVGFALYATLAVMRLETWRALTSDMGWYSQALWTISQGHLSQATTLIGMPPIGQAESYVLYPLAVIYRFAGQPGVLVVQAAALASGVLPLARFVQRRGVPVYLSVFLLVAYLCYPAVAGANLFDFHPDVVVIPLFFWALQALEERRWPLYLAMIGLAPLVKNDLAAVTIVMALPLIYRRYWGLAALTAGWGLAILILDLHVVGPHFAHTITDWGEYSYLGSTPHQALFTLLTHPGLLWQRFTRPRALQYLAILLIPLLVWPVVRGLATGVVWPGLAVMGINVLSVSASDRIDPYAYFSVAAAPFLFWAVAQWFPTRVSPRVATATFALVTVLSVTTGVVARKAFYWPSNPPIAALDHAAHVIPAAAPLYGSQTTLPLLSDRRLLYKVTKVSGLRKPVPGAWLLLSTWDAPWQAPEGNLVRYALRHGSWTLRYHQGSVWLFEATPRV